MSFYVPFFVRVSAVALLTGSFILSSCGPRQQAGDSIVLEVYYSAPLHIDAFYKEKFKQFEEKYPGIKIKTQATSSGAYYTILQTRFAGKTAPDVIYMQNKSLADYDSKNVLLNLKEYIDKENYDIGDICELAFEEGGMTENRICGMPVTGTPEVLIYNKDLFDTAGLDYPDKSWTWNDVLEASKVLTCDTDGDGRIDQIGIAVSPGWWAADFPIIWANGGEIFTKDMTKCIAASPEAEEAIQFQIDLINKYKVTSKGTTIASEGAGGVELFMSGRLGMWPILPFVALTEFSQAKNLNWDLTLMPKGEKKRVVRYTGESWVIYKGAKHPKASWELVKFLASPETAQGLAELNQIPARLSVLNSPAFIKPLTPYREEIIVESLKYARAIPSLKNVEKMGSIWRNYITLAILEKISVKDALEKIEKEINDLLLD